MKLAKSGVCVVLNLYKRPEMLLKQIDAIRNQSFKVSSIMIWNNGNDAEYCQSVSKEYTDVKIANSNVNYGVWARFAFALNATTEFVCLWDDDILPGKKWIENCVRSFKKEKGLYGARGLIFKDKEKYTPNYKIGWSYPCNDITKVDIVGHSWFLKTSWLSAFWGETEIEYMDPHSGEDMQLSYALKKILNVETFVPPHPANDLELWGNILLDKNIASDNNALSLKPGAFDKFDRSLLRLRKKGFKPIERNQENIKLNTRIIRNILKTDKWDRKSIIYKNLKKVANLLRKKGFHF
jgi:hypothetical protein